MKNKILIILSLAVLLIGIISVVSAEIITSDLQNIISEKTNEEIQIIISFKEKPIPSQVQELVNENAKIRHEYNIINAVAVKIPANAIERISRKMNSQPYTFVNYDMLKEAIGPYENIQGINEDREELLKKIKIIKEESNKIINYIDESSKLKVGAISTDEEKLPFPKATITNKLRQELEEGKTIKGPVKKGLNIWLGKIVERVSKKMDTYPYAYIDRSMFKDSIETYEAVGEIELEKERIIQQMESMKTVCDILTMEVERKFRI